MQSNIVRNIQLIVGEEKSNLDFTENNLIVDIPFPKDFKSNNIFLKIEFVAKIKQIRLADYTWGALNEDRIIPQFCNQIIQLENGLYFQSQSPKGIWEVKKSEPNVLYWLFNPEHAFQLTTYKGKHNFKQYKNAQVIFEPDFSLRLLGSDKGAVEISRSPYPFSAIACFTDHCDFDTLGSLIHQRVFFKETGIVVTKGFFLNHFSKRTDNASWENDSEELKKWVDDNHELAYHSLSQSLKTAEESKNDFFSFIPPTEISSWIDHGYQPYNLSLYENEGITGGQFSAALKTKNIQILWNYIDSGTATEGVVNQLSTKDFTLEAFSKGIKNKPIKKKIELLVKNIIFHFYGDEKLIRSYTQLATVFKKIIQSKSPSDFINFIRIGTSVFVPLFKVVLFWNSYKKKVYPLAKYSPVFFEHTISGEKFTIFQTLELLDFVNALSKESIDKLVNEKGLFIGHTYFSVPMAYHDGRIFSENGTIQDAVSRNFTYLGEKIKQKEIWNPTLSELVEQWKKFQRVEFKITENKEIEIDTASDISYRKIV